MEIPPAPRKRTTAPLWTIISVIDLIRRQTQDEPHLPRLSTEWRRRAPDAGGEFVTIAGLLINQGRQEGRGEGRLETLEQLVRSGVEWPLIESAAGSDPDTLRTLKERLATRQTNGRANGTDQPEAPR